MFDTDHLNTFFLDNLPVFARRRDRRVQGAERRSRARCRSTTSSRLPDFGAHLRRAGIEAGFDLALVQEFTVDHSVAVPLHFMTPRMQCPGRSDLHQWTYPTAAEGAALLRTGSRGEARDRNLADAAARRHHGQRQLLARRVRTAHRARPHRRRARPRLVQTRVRACSSRATVATIVEESTEAQMLKAGNVGGELLNWIAMLGTIGAKTPIFVKPQMQNGHAYAAWLATEELTMSVYAVNYICRELLRDHKFRAAMKADPATALAPPQPDRGGARRPARGRRRDALPDGRQRLPDGLSVPLRGVRPHASESTTSASAPPRRRAPTRTLDSPAFPAPGVTRPTKYEHGPAYCGRFALVIVSVGSIVIFSGFLPSKYSLARWRRRACPPRPAA